MTEFSKSVRIRDEIFSRNPVDIDAEYRLCSSLVRMGQVKGDLYELDKAEEMLVDGTAKARSLLKREPGNKDYQNLLTRSLYSLGWVYSNQGKDQEGYNHHEYSLQNCKKTLEQYPDDLDALDGYLATLKYMANWLANRGIFDNAKIRWQEVIDLSRAYEEKQTQNPVFVAHRLQGERGLARVSLQADQLGPALEGLRASVHPAEEAREKFPNDRGIALQLAWCQAETADLLLRKPTSLEGMQLLSDAIATLSALLPPEPNPDVELQYTLTLVLKRAWLLSLQGRHKESLADYDFVLQYQRPEESTDTLVLRAVSQIRMGQLAEGMAVIDKVMEKPPESGRTCYNIACAYAVAAAADSVREQELADRSMAMLQESLTHGFWDVTLMEKDADLKFLHTRKDFGELVSAMRKRRGEEKDVTEPIQ